MKALLLSDEQKEKFLTLCSKRKRIPSGNLPRVGLPEDARVFRARAAAYQEQISAIRKKRETAEQYWQDLEKKYLALKDGTQKKIADLNKQVSQLQGEVREVASQPRTERIIVPPIIRTWNYPPPPVFIRPQPPPPRPDCTISLKWSRNDGIQLAAALFISYDTMI